MRPALGVAVAVVLLALGATAQSSRRRPPLGNPLPGGGRMPWAQYIALQLASGQPTCTGALLAPCIIEAGTKVLITTNVRVRSLTIFGDVLVQPPSTGGLRLDSAFILVKGPGARFAINNTSWSRQVTVFLRRNPAAYDDLPPAPSDEDKMLGGGRALAAWQGAQVVLDGFPLRRTWSLLTKDVMPDDRSICISDDVTTDWPVGSVIAIAPSDNTDTIWQTSLDVRVGAQSFSIVSVQQASTSTVCCPQPGKGGSGCTGSLIRLNASVAGTPMTLPPPASYPGVPVYLGSQPPVQSEVLMLNRTITITGSDFSARYKPIPPPPWPNPNDPSGQGVWPTPWSPNANSTHPVEGLHVLAVGKCSDGSANGANCQSAGGFLAVRYTRVEKAGQRGWIGRYPLHAHKMGDCPSCEFTGNAVVWSSQRGIVVHSTHNAKVVRNVVFAVKGAYLYVEEGTEVGNTFQENALVCDVGIASYTKFVGGKWVDAGLNDPNQGKAFGGGGCQTSSVEDFGNPAFPLGGCRVQGTDNDQADCAQQAGVWALSASNNFIGNRVSNMYNGIYFQSTLFRWGRLGTDSLKRICPMHSQWGRMQGNVVHSNQRFGFYPDVNYPNNQEPVRNVATNGYLSDMTDKCVDDLTNTSPGAVCGCRPYSATSGAANGQPATLIEDGVDWGNGFVGQYDLGDVQYKNFTSINNNIGMYWKGGKNFRTVGTSLIKDSLFHWFVRQPDPACPAPYPSFLMSQWSYWGTAGTSLLQLPGASATLILENVVLRGSPGIADWLTSGVRNGGQGSALAINQQCKYFKGLTNPLGPLGYDEGALCTPQVVLVNVTFDIFECRKVLGQEQANLPVWVNIGAANGNNHLGVVTAADDSLCGGKMSPCPIRSVVSNYSTHLLDLPGDPCVMPSLTNASAQFGPDWYRRFNGHMVCTREARRFNIWGPDQGPMLLLPPGGKRPWVLNWLGFGVENKDGSFTWGSQTSKDEERRWAEGYGATVLSSKELPGVWKLTRVDGQPVDLSKIRMLEFSDEVFGVRFAAENMTLQIDANPPCLMASTDPRLWMTAFGPVSRGGGSCVTLLAQFPMGPS